jgi:hypothetical protein
MKKIILLVAILLSFRASAQELKKPTYGDVRAYNQTNLLKLSIGMSKESALFEMGGIKSFVMHFIPNSKNPGLGKTKDGGVINNPYSRDLKTDKDGHVIEILWYYTDIKSASGAIRKEDLTPIVFEENKLIGIGWGFYEDYSKRKEINININ